MSITIISDLHGDMNKYRQLTDQYRYTFQLGDFSIRENDWLRTALTVDPEHHKIGQGNHDYHPILTPEKAPAAFVGRYGLVELNDRQFYWIGGALSIDMFHRIDNWYVAGKKSHGHSWWPQEQLTLDEQLQVLKDIELTKPEIIIAHTCPSIFGRELEAATGSEGMLARYGFSPNPDGTPYKDSTTQLLDKVFEIHQPNLFCCGHWHVDHHHRHIWDGGNHTDFHCIGAGSTLEI